MKLKLTRPDGSILECEGTAEECAAIAGLASINVGPAPEIHNHYHYTLTPHPPPVLNPYYPPYDPLLPPNPCYSVSGSQLPAAIPTVTVATNDFDKSVMDVPVPTTTATSGAQR